MLVKERPRMGDGPNRQDEGIRPVCCSARAGRERGAESWRTRASESEPKLRQRCRLRARIDELKRSGFEEVEDESWIMLSAVLGQGVVIQTRSWRGMISERTIERQDTAPNKFRFVVDFETSATASVDKHQHLASSLDVSWTGTNLLALQMWYAVVQEA